ALPRRARLRVPCARVFRRVRSSDLVLPPRRDRVRPEGDPGRWVREDRWDEPLPERRAAGGRGPGVRGQATLATSARDPRGTALASPRRGHHLLGPALDDG